MAPPVILYGYPQSLFTRKIEYTLLLKGISYNQVNVPVVLPRKGISELLGVTYRRVPIVAIGKDVYCDSSLITMALERHFPPSARYGSILPKVKHGEHVDTGLVKTLSQQVESALSPLTVSLLPWDEYPQSFIQDRASFYGRPIDRKSVTSSRHEDFNTFNSYLGLMEEQLCDGREWLFNTEQPGLADVTFYSIFAWVRSLPTVHDLIPTNVFPFVTTWLERFSTLIDYKRRQFGTPKELTAEQAAAIIMSSSHQPIDAVGFDSTDASRIQVQKGGAVSIAPTDTGMQHPTMGRLLALSKSESVIEVAGTRGTVRCHFPRLNFSITSKDVS